ncbi:MAG: hypothetical protein JXR19_05420 [Bacteroidia bacterium]
MKKWFAISLLSLLVISSCKEVETPNSPDPKDGLESWLPGKWNLTEVSQENGIISVNGFQTSTFTSVGKNIIGSIEFTKNPDEYSSSTSYDNVMTVVILNQTTEQTIPINGTDSGSWSVNDQDNIELVSSTQTTEYEVLESSSTRIKVKFPWLLTQTNTGITTVTSADVIAVYQK